MKILLCLNLDIYCLVCLNFLLKKLGNHQIKIYFSTQVGKEPNNADLQNLQKLEKDLSIKNITSLLEKSGVKGFAAEGFPSEDFLSLEQIKEKYQILDFKNINQDGLDFFVGSGRTKNFSSSLMCSL